VVLLGGLAPVVLLVERGAVRGAVRVQVLAVLEEPLELALVLDLEGDDEAAVIAQDALRVRGAEHDLVAEQGLDLRVEVEALLVDRLLELLGHLAAERELVRDRAERLPLGAVQVGVDRDDERRALRQVAEGVVERVLAAATARAAAAAADGDRAG